jgi:hypothetical protein
MAELSVENTAEITGRAEKAKQSNNLTAMRQAVAG